MRPDPKRHQRLDIAATAAEPALRKHPASRLRAIYPPRCWRRPWPPIHVWNRARDGRSAPSSGSWYAQAVCRSWAGSRQAPGRGMRTSDGGHEAGRPQARRATLKRYQWLLKSDRRAPGLRPAMTQGLPAARGKPVRTLTAAGDNGTARGPVLLSRSRSSFTSRCTSSHRKSESRCAGTRSASAGESPPPHAPAPVPQPPARPAPGQAGGTPLPSGTARVCAACT